jgi:uncharacterized membrane-anchored protein
VGPHPKAFGQELPPAVAPTAEEFEAKLRYQQGVLQLPGGLATLKVPAEFRYLDPDQTERVLVKGWGNPPGQHTLGMLFPSDRGVLDRGSWGAVIQFQEDGYVSDEGAEKIDYAKLLKELQEGAHRGNEARKKQGYSAVEVVGWASPPRYDRATHKLYWAKDLHFEGQDQDTLNYETRVLGRRGVLIINAVGSLDQLPEIEHGMQTVLGFVDFNEGHRYTDFIPGKDKVAAYGIAALVAGTIAAKAGLFKVLLAALLAAKKFIVLAVAALLAFLRRVFGRNKAARGSTDPTPL